MPYGTVKVDNVTFTNNSVDATTTFSGIYASITNNLTLSGTATAATFTGTTANFTNVNAQNISVTTSLSGLAITGGTAGFTTITGTTVTGTTANFVTVSGTTVTGNTGQFTNLAGAAAGFTTVTGTTVTGTTANFVSGVFTTRISGTTVTGTTASFTSGVFASLSGTTHTITSGVFALGTAALPSISFVSDPNTGIYSPGADQVAVATNGVQRLFVSSAGLVSIGNSSPGSRLEIGGDASYDAKVTFNRVPVQASNDGVIGELFFQNNADSVGLIAVKRESAIDDAYIQFATQQTSGGLSEKMRITSAGLVGIGTSAPGEPLNVIGGGSTTSTVNFTGAGGIDNATIASDYSLFFQIDANNNIGGRVYTWSYGGKGYSDGTPLMTLDASGRLGIGTTSPGEKLEINGATGLRANSGGYVAKFLNSASTGELTGFIYDNNQDNLEITAYDSSYALAFKTNNTERMRLDTSGRLLVGTSTARSNVYIGGSSTTPLIQSETSGSTYNNGASLLTYSTVNYAPILTLGTSNSDTAGTNAADWDKLRFGFYQFCW
jgi:hypothetical protein